MFRSRGFILYIFIIFCNSFVDLGHKILIQNTLYQSDSASQFSLYSSLINALILLPYLFLFTPSGFVADKFSKTTVLRITAFAAIPLTLLVTWSYYQGYFKFAFFMTLLLAVQSVFNSPAKYGYIKEIFGKANIAKVNAFVQTTVIIAILAGTFVFSIIFNYYLMKNNLLHSVNKTTILKNIAPAGYVLVLLSIAETICTLMLPKHKAVDPDSHYEARKYVQGIYLKDYLQKISHTPVILLCILGLAIFWGINQVLLASYGAYLKNYAGNPSAVFVQGALAIGGIGVLLGATYAGRVSRGFIESGMIPIAAFGVSVALFILSLLTTHVLILSLFLVYGFFGGMLVVPLNALIQFNAKDKHLGKILASNNFMQTAFMLAFLLINIVYTTFGGNVRALIFALCFVTLLGSLYSILALPQSLIRYIVYFIVSKIYRIDVSGLDNIPSVGGVLLLGNHTSYLDWALIQIASPRPVRFVMERTIFNKWYLKWILSRLKMIPISTSGSKQSIETIHVALKNGEVVCLFPEGRLSRNGQIGKFNDGFEKAVYGSSAVVIPFYLRGLWGSRTSHATTYYKRISARRHRSISVNFGVPLSDQANTSTVKQHVMKLSISAWKSYVENLGTIPELWLTRVKQLPSEISVIDSSGAKFTNAELLSTVMYLCNQLSKKIHSEQNIGILLPTSAGGVLASLSVLCLGKTLVNLNYTSSSETLSYVAKEAEIKTIITAKKFIKQLKNKGYNLSSVLEHVNVLYIENFKKPRSKLTIIRNFILVRVLPVPLLKSFFLCRTKNNAVAAILFSSGSEGRPKGVKLTHRNIVGNVKQISSVFNIQDDDVVLSTLPQFHAFGFTATTVMPLVEGVPIVTHPDPTDAINIGKLVYTHDITFMCGTSTLFGLYCRNKKLLPQMFDSLRLIIAGAEKLNENVRIEFKNKFNRELYEGYGATEVAPVASANLPDILDGADWHVQVCNRVGTVGLPLPGTAFRVVDPTSFEERPLGEEGMVLIGGTQVMQGYLNNSEITQAVLIPDGEITWYVTGDKGRMDSDGYLTILDRYSRFAKIAGEMISLSWLEQEILKAINKKDIEIMAFALADPKKGERIIIIHTDADLNKQLVRAALTHAGISSLAQPAAWYYREGLPKLGSGKRDYLAAKNSLADLLEKTL